jgi:hypothetical protein
LGVAEIFQRVRGGTPMAFRRAVGLDLWNLHGDWLKGGSGPLLERLPSEVWMVGMGNLGQAYLWTVGLLPYGHKALRLVLQDTDIVAHSNLSTSMLTNRIMLRTKKTRATAEWAQARGFEASVVERNFAPNFMVGPREPSVALIGVDNALARQAVEDVGFGRVIEAGLGQGPQDFLGIDLHTFPASRPAREVWPQAGVSDADDADITLPAYRAMLEQSGDRCGTMRLAGRSIVLRLSVQRPRPSPSANSCGCVWVANPTNSSPSTFVIHEISSRLAGRRWAGSHAASTDRYAKMAAEHATIEIAVGQQRRNRDED